MLKRTLKISGLLLALLLLAAGGYYLANKPHFDAFPSLPSAYYAKEFCSCRFVLGHDEAFCHDYARIDFPKILADPRGGLSVDEARKVVVVEAMGRRARARYVGDRVGCRLED